jgi:two-component system chemotaxis response regulator CheY
MAKILVVDDEEAIRALMKRLLSLHGHDVDTADDGAAAVDQLQKKHYDLMLIDHFMPVMSGLKAVSVVRSTPKFKDLKILMVTLASYTKDVDEAFEAGIDGYVVKPFNMKQIMDKIELTLLKGRAQ